MESEPFVKASLYELSRYFQKKRLKKRRKILSWVHTPLVFCFLRMNFNFLTGQVFIYIFLLSSSLVNFKRPCDVRFDAVMMISRQENNTPATHNSNQGANILFLTFKLWWNDQTKKQKKKQTAKTKNKTMEIYFTRSKCYRYASSLH